MDQLRKPRFLYRLRWILFAAIFLPWAGVLGVGILDLAVGPPAQSELIKHSGAAADSQTTTHGAGPRGRTYSFLRFTIADQPLHYSTRQPAHHQVFAAVRGGHHVEVWTSPPGDGLLDRSPAIYKMAVADRVILTYAETAAHRRQKNLLMLGAGALGTALGASVIIYQRRSRHHRRQSTAKRERIIAGDSRLR